MRGLFVALTALTLSSACAARDAAQLVVVVSSDLAVPSELDALEIRLRDGAGEIVEERGLSLAGRPSTGQVLGSFGVTPLDGDVRRGVDVEVGAVKGGDVLFRARVKTRFVSGAKLRLDVFLAASCVEAACPESVMCLRGACMPPVDVDPATLPPYDGDPVPQDSGVDAGPPRDAGDRDASDLDASERDAGVDTDAGADGGGAGDAAADAGPADAAVPACSVTSPFRVEEASGREPSEPSIQWNGSELGLVWAAFDPAVLRQDLAFARVAASGTERLDRGALRIDSTNTGTTSRILEPQLVWTGTDYAVVYADTRVAGTPQRGDVYLARFAADASAPSLVTALASTEGYEDAPSVAWSGAELGVAWRLDYGFGRFARFDGAGGLLSAPADLDQRSRVALAYDPTRTEWIIVSTAWVSGDDYDMYVDRANAAGQRVSTIPTPLSTAPTAAAEPAVVVAGAEWAVAWVELAPEPAPWRIHFGHGTPGAGLRGASLDVAEQAPASDGPALAWRSDAGYLLAFRDGLALRIARITAAGVRVQDVTIADGATSRPSLVADGAGFALAWTDSRGVNVALVRCP
ncbi:hypothetical protein L6R52_24320 [Myxococcota bacterium]|nr:hypothetical protein [Myxococcota bacterium]